MDFVKGLYAALKPGGVLGVIDHVGIAGPDNKALHRMLPQQARDVLTKAGFTIEAESTHVGEPGRRPRETSSSIRRSAARRISSCFAHGNPVESRVKSTQVGCEEVREPEHDGHLA